MFHHTIPAGSPYGLPLHHTILPQYLSHLNYTSHHIGKWHMGCHEATYTPTHRGFSSHTGYWEGMQDYYDHTIHSRVRNFPLARHARLFDSQ